MAYEEGIKPEDIIVEAEGEDKPDAAAAAPAVKEKMTAKEFQSLVFNRATAGRTFTESSVRAERAQATDYYKGRLPDVDGEEVKEDRSRAVLSEVRDTVLGMMPDLMRVFTSSADGVVEYKPVVSEDPETFAKNQQDAKQATEYVRSAVLGTDNPDFFITLHDAFKDALVRKTGFIRWYWEKSKKPEYSFYTGLPEDAALALASDDEVEIVEKSTRIIQPNSDLMGSTAMTPPQGMTAPQGMMASSSPQGMMASSSPQGMMAPPAPQPYVVYDLQVKRICDYGKIKICGVPCENIIISDEARSTDDAPMVGYIEEWNAGDFIERGFVDSLEELADCDTDSDAEDSDEAQARRPNRDSVIGNDKEPSEDPSQRKVLYGELYILADVDGDGIPELRRVHTAGTKYKVLSNEPWDEVDYAAFCPIPEAHTFFGESIADVTMDIQRIKSRIVRDMLDSLAQSVKPQMGVVEGQVNLDDVLNPDTSNVIRMRAPNMIYPIETSFVGKDAMPVLDFLTNVRENRTGMSDASQGLNPKDLQSADADAVANTLSKGAARIELIARIFCETGMKRLFRGVLRLLQKHQTQSRMVEINGRPTKIDPKHWNAGMHVETTIPLGRGSHASQIGFLTGVLSKQEHVLQMLGPQNPLVTLEQYRYTWAQILSLGGFRNTDSFITDPAKLAPEQRQQLEQAMMAAMAQAAGGGKSQGPAAPDPAIEKAKIESAERIKQAELAQKAAEMQAEMQFKSVELQAHMELEVAKAQIAANSSMDVAQLNAIVKSASDRLAAATKIAVEKLKPRGGSDNGGGQS